MIVIIQRVEIAVTNDRPTDAPDANPNTAVNTQ